MTVATSLAIEIVAVECGECGVAFGMSQLFYDKRHEDHRTWYCPNGHRRAYMTETEAEKAKRLLTEEQDAHALTWALLDEKNKEVRQLKRRAAAGVCPCCQRTFIQLARHMAKKHPDFAQDVGVRAGGGRE